ncbi:MAG: response regulator transcription factor [Lachnospiraceae bacterium]|nr:response regulator transcription factor [Lachnospiraceae bacterium]
MRYTVLIADDEADIIDMLSLYMDSNDFWVLKANDGETALRLLRNNKVDIALVDIMMPKMNGYEFIRNARKEYNLPVIVLSAKSEDTDKVMGLNIGADAYITKPFNPFEVIAYLKAMLRRYYELGASETSHTFSEVLTVGELELDMESFTLRRNGQMVLLTSSEFKILSLLMRSPGRVYTKPQIYGCINRDYYESDDNTIMVHISNIRAKIEEDPSNPKYIKTIRVRKSI